MSARPDLVARLARYDRYLRALERQKAASQRELNAVYERYKGHRPSCSVADRPLQLPSECTCGKADVDRLSNLLFLMVHAEEQPDGRIDGKAAWYMRCPLCKETELSTDGHGEGVCTDCRASYSEVRRIVRPGATMVSLPSYHQICEFEVWFADRQARVKFVSEMRSFLNFVESLG